MKKQNITHGFYMYGTEFLPGDRVWVDTVDHEHIKGTILDVFRWYDYTQEIDCIEMEMDDGEYCAFDDFDIAYIEYANDEEKGGNVE